MFSPYSPALDSDAGTLSVLVTAELAVGGIAALFFLVAPGETDEHAVNQLISKAAISATRPRATVFHQSCGSLVLNIVFIFLPLFLQVSPAQDTSHRAKHPARSAAARFRIPPPEWLPLRGTCGTLALR